MATSDAEDKPVWERPETEQITKGIRADLVWCVGVTRKGMIVGITLDAAGMEKGKAARNAKRDTQILIKN